MFSLFEWSKRELVFVCVVVLFIVGISAYQIRLGDMKARDAQRRSDTELVARGLKEYYKQYGQYPMESSGKVVSCGSRGTEVCEWGDSQLVDADSVTYIKNMPREPLTDKGLTYVYEVNGERKKFRVYARLEYVNDDVVKSDLTVGCGNGLQCNWYVE